MMGLFKYRVCYKKQATYTEYTSVVQTAIPSANTGRICIAQKL